MNAHYTLLAAFDAPSSNPASFSSISVPSPPDFAFTTHNAPSFPHEFAMLQHAQQQQQQQQHTYAYTTHPTYPINPTNHINHTNHWHKQNHIRTNNDSDPDTSRSPRSQSQSHPSASESASATDFDADFDFDFARSLRSVRRSSAVTSRPSSSSQGGHGHGYGGLGLGFLGSASGLGEEPERLRPCGQAPTESEAAVAETIVRARKSWKTVKGRSEPVWPPQLEKALVQALLQYKPHDSRYVRALGRFPKRNRYISDFIFAETGVRRTPKQVGSRLQQLKDVSCGKMLLNHVAQWSLSPPSRFTTGPVSAASSSPSSTHHSDLDVNIIPNDVVHAHGYWNKSEGSQSPVSPLGVGGPGLGPGVGFVPASSTTTPAESPHMELALPQGDWYTYASQMYVR